jgi:hypothetical protein
MSERYQRCRMWPHCSIHLGEPEPRVFSEANAQEMRELRGRGETLAEIAAQFGTGPGAVARLTSDA